MVRTGINMERVKRQNRTAILSYIHGHGAASRKDIAEATQLTPASVTQNTTELLREGLLVEIGTADDDTHAAGRKKVLLSLNTSYAYVYAVNIEPEQTTVALCDIHGEALKNNDVPAIERIPTDHESRPEDFLKQLAALCHTLSDVQPESVKKRISAVSVGITGIVDKERAIAKKAYGIWQEEVPVGKILARELKKTVYLRNNVDAFSLAELLFGVGRQTDSLLVIKWGPGVGSTIVIDNDIYEGRHGKTAEIGHFIVEPDGKKCACGRRGCLETKVSYRALNEIQPFTPETFGEVYRTAAAEKRKAFDEAIDLFSRTIVNAGALLAPGRIVLEGSLLQSEDIRKRLISRCKAYDESYHENRIIFSGLFSREDYIGPVAVFVQQEIIGG